VSTILLQGNTMPLSSNPHRFEQRRRGCSICSTSSPNRTGPSRPPTHARAPPPPPQGDPRVYHFSPSYSLPAALVTRMSRSTIGHGEASDRLFVFTASGAEAYQHYIDTIENGFLLNSVASFLPATDLVGYQRHYFPQGFSVVNQEKTAGLIARFGSVEGFLNYLAEGKWVAQDPKDPKEVRKEIIKERVAKQVGKTQLLEGNLENFLAERVNQIEPGLKLMDRQLDTKEVGRLDLLCEDKDSNLVVVELKKFKAGSSIIDQIQRYMGWVIAHRSKEGQKVRGIIIVCSKDTALEYAAKANPLISVKVFTIAFE
jgi:hypothetical protein